MMNIWHRKILVWNTPNLCFEKWNCWGHVHGEVSNYSHSEILEFYNFLDFQSYYQNFRCYKDEICWCHWYSCNGHIHVNFVSQVTSRAKIWSKTLHFETKLALDDPVQIWSINLHWMNPLIPWPSTEVKKVMIIWS